MHYRHVSMEERKVIFYSRRYGFSLAKIADVLNRDKSMISRELRRHCDDGDSIYNAWSADARSEEKKRWRRKRPKTGNRQIMKYVTSKLSRQWSPQEISGRLKWIDAQDDPSKGIAPETIYRWNKVDKKNGGTYYKQLRQGHRKRRKRYGSASNRGQIKDRVSIDERPKIVDERKRLGDWEGDTIVGKNHKELVATCVDRCSRYLIARKMPDKTADSLNRAIRNGFRNIPKDKTHTLTVDNGKEFANFKQLEKSLKVQVYFAHPYSSWERGTNENTNGLLRQYIPKKTDLRELDQKTWAKYVRRLNNRPRKILNYRTPCEVFLNNRNVALVM